MLPRQPPSSFFRTAGLLLALALPAASCRIFRGKPPPPPPPPPPRVIRPDRVPPLTGFEQLAGWTVESPRATVRLDKEAEGALWGSFAARVTAEPLETGLHAVTITPARNLVVNSVFNTVLVWVREETPGLLRPDHRIVLSVRDAAGVRRDIAMPYQPQAGWQMLHLRLGESPPWPLTVEHLRWEFPVGDPASPPRVLWLDSLACYQEILTRIPQDTLYARPFGYAPSHARTGTGNVTLDFPASPLAFLPASTSPRQSLAVESGRDRQFVLRSEAEDGLLEYLVDAEEDGPRLSVRWNGRE